MAVTHLRTVARKIWAWTAVSAAILTVLTLLLPEGD